MGSRFFCEPLQHGYETLCDSEPVWCTSVTRSLTKYQLWLDDGYGWYVGTSLTLSLERGRIVHFPVGRIWHNKFIDTNIRPVVKGNFGNFGISDFGMFERKKLVFIKINIAHDQLHIIVLHPITCKTRFQFILGSVDNRQKRPIVSCDVILFSYENP